MNRILVLCACISIGLNLFSFKAYEPLETEDYADLCGLSVDEFVLFSSVVEAESNRQAPTDGALTTEGRVYIALVIWNRLYDYDRWHCDSITAVLTAPGQFSTVRGGQSVTQRTEWSDRAVYEAYIWLNEKNSDAPDVQFFNCRYWFSGVERYGDSAIGGNYFSLGG